MPTRSVIAVVLCASALCYLGYRTMALEDRIEALTRELGATQAPAASGAPAPSKSSRPGSAGAAHEQRLAALEDGVNTVQLKLRAISYAIQAGPSLPDPQEIVSIVKRENSRLVNTQLAWSQTRWREARVEQMSQFARDFGLSTEQTATMQKSLTHEVDAMVEVLRRPTLFEEPERTVNDWQAVRTVTDEMAQRTLTPAQLQAWNLVREFERKILYPWLPEKK